MSEPITVSYSELDTFRQCPLKWWTLNVQKWSKPDQPGQGKTRGTLWHSVMQNHYESLRFNRGMPADELIPSATSAVFPVLNDDAGLRSEDQELAEWMYDGYVQRWGIDPDWEIVDIEEKLVVPLPRPPNMPDSGREFLLKCKIDLGVIEHGFGKPAYWVVDSKSAKDTARRGELELADQFGLYQWAKRQQGVKAAGSLYNGARTQRNTADWPDYAGKLKPQTLEQRFVRERMHRTPLELTRLAADAWITADEAYGMLERRRSADIPVYSSPDPSVCKWKCDMKEVHLLMRKHQKVNLPVLLKDFGFTNYGEPKA